MSNQDNTNTNMSICSSREKMLGGLNDLEDIRKIMVLNNKVAKIVLEETIAVKWPEIKKMIKQIKVILPTLKNTVIWNIPHMKNLIIFTEDNLHHRYISPCMFSDFLERMLQREDIGKNIRFLKYVLKDNVQCQRVFRKA